MNSLPFPDLSPNQQSQRYDTKSIWLGLIIGNSRLHWAKFSGSDVQTTWDTPHLSSLAEGIGVIAKRMNITFATPELWIASVVPNQSEIWRTYSPVHFVPLEQVPLQGLYPTLGVDRALAAWGATIAGGSPVLVIDGGTALTFTGVNAEGCFVGGAILPGAHLQFQTLNQSTASLPMIDYSNDRLPSRWAANTQDAIASGIIYTLVAGIKAFLEDWWHQFPESRIVLTGGDGEQLLNYLKQYEPAIASKVTVDPFLIFRGMQSLRDQSLTH